MFNKGFTLTEVLLATGVVGVIAAMTIPQMYTNVLRTNTGTLLGRTVQQIETSCKNMLRIDSEQNNDYNENLALMNNPSFTVDNIGQYFSARISDNTSAVTTYSGTAYTGLDKSTRFDFLKLPASFSIEIFDIANNNNNSDTNIAKIYIDVNSFAKPPNNLGRDIFYFNLTNGGRMVPYGIETFNNVANSNNDKCIEGNIGTGEGCAAKVVADGFKINY